MRLLSLLAIICIVSLALSMNSEALTLNVCDYGAIADGKTDATSAFQKALDAATSQPGSSAYAPAGTYLIAGTIRIPASTTLKGDYSGPGRQKGTIILSTFGKGKSDGPGCIVMSGGSGLCGIAVIYPGQKAESREPIPYPYAITGAGDVRIQDIYLHNAYQGINLDGAHTNSVRNVWGEPLKVGINVDHCYDISRIENVHFWPYFTLDKPMREWVQQNGVAFQFGRSDWQYCLNTFSFGYHTGYRFFRTGESKPSAGVVYPAGTTNGNFVGIGADKCAIGVDVEDCFNIDVSITNAEIAPFGKVEGSRAVLLRKGNTGNLTFLNCNFWAVPSSLFEIHSGSLNISACNIHEWAVVKKDSSCIIQTGGRLNVNGCTFSQGGKLAVLDGADARALFSGNMGVGPLKVINRIGNRAVVGTNNPRIEVSAESPSAKVSKD